MKKLAIAMMMGIAAMSASAQVNYKMPGGLQSARRENV